MNAKPKKTKIKKFSIALPEREGKLLKMYADDYGISRPEALRRMVRDALREYRSKKGEIVPDNQLGLFDSIQIDIFADSLSQSDSDET